MDDKVLTTIIGGVAGLVTGAIGSLFAPWIHWGIEKRRYKRAARKELVSSFRASLQECINCTTTISVGDRFRSWPSYYQIRPNLNQDYVAELERFWDSEVRSPAVSSLINRMLDDLACLEKDWDLL
jgi:hypothetical protein